jgi:hypothetical protein
MRIRTRFRVVKASLSSILGRPFDLPCPDLVLCPKPVQASTLQHMQYLELACTSLGDRSGLADPHEHPLSIFYTHGGHIGAGSRNAV